MSDNIIERLRQLDTGTLSDALDRHQISGALLGLARLSGHERVVGRAVTVRLEEFSGQVSPRHLGTAAVEASDDTNVIVVANAGRTHAAAWGGILARAASRRQVAGVVVDGVCRDLDEIREFGLPVYARGAVPVSARGRVVEAGWSEPVTLCGVTVAPGDYVLADASGVVAVPAADVEGVLETAEQIASLEHQMVTAVESGTPVSQVMGRNYELMTEKSR
ncbi:RraA family protein [Nocardia vaccinii]|uniref:RraA family protein n=1 Tax=Nocardia vaccinii TaxID=1822 RepID=UPI0008339630|nr:hypothetical protein [Nocardia vaccinii]